MTQRICTVTILRAPLKLTLQFVAYHLHIGVEHMYLFFDDPADPAAEALAKNERVTCFRCDAAFWQASGAPRPDILEERQDYTAAQGLSLARAQGYDWIAHIDSDELLYASGNLHDALAQVPVSEIAVRFITLEAVPQHHQYADPLQEITTFRLLGPSITRFFAKLLGCRRAFYEGEYMRGHYWGKSVVRTSARIKTLGNHRPFNEDGSKTHPIPMRGLYLLHFDTTGLDSFRKKWQGRLDGSGTVARIRSNRQQQMNEFADLQNNDEAVTRLYERLYFLPAYEKFILRTLGLLKTVKVEIPELPQVEACQTG